MSAPRRGDRERGAALLIVLFVLVVAWTATLLVSIALSSDLRAERADQRRLRLTVLSDSALAEAMAALADDAFASGEPWHPFGGGEIGSTIGDIDGTSRTVTAGARIGGVERTIVARVELGPWGPRVAAWEALPPRPVGAQPATAD